MSIYLTKHTSLVQHSQSNDILAICHDHDDDTMYYKTNMHNVLQNTNHFHGKSFQQNVIIWNCRTLRSVTRKLYAIIRNNFIPSAPEILQAWSEYILACAS